ncbi:MAG: hypothetical protein R3268_11660, partial [Acidiferrobacterales bacterium]|nr:hypothetical protein [Acidiferrobacterales bacterium]
MIAQKNNFKLLKRDGHSVHQRKGRASIRGQLLLPIWPRAILIVISLTLLLIPTPVAGQEPEDDALSFETLRDHIGQTEEVSLSVYFIGFPPTLHQELRQTVHETLNSTTIVDARPWWLPNIPKYGAPDFALAPAPAWLPPELTPPDGMLRYDAVSLTKFTDPGSGRDIWLPNKELVDLVDDYHHNLDIVNNVEHSGALLDVPWRADPITVHFLPAQLLDDLYPQLEQSRTALESANPAVTFDLYSYNELFDWLEKERRIREQRGGATLVFLNLAEFSGETYTFYAEPAKDVVPAIGNGPVEQQYAPATATTPEHQAVADLMSV